MVFLPPIYIQNYDPECAEAEAIRRQKPPRGQACVLCERVKAALEADPVALQTESLVVIGRLRDGGIVVAAKEHGTTTGATRPSAEQKAEIESLLPEHFRGRQAIFDMHLSVWYERSEYFWITEHFACAWLPACRNADWGSWGACQSHTSVPSEIADAQVAVLQEAVRWFHDHDCPIMFGDPTVGRISDEEVRRRIHEWTIVMDKEVARQTVGFGFYARHDKDADLSWHDNWCALYREYLAEEGAHKDCKLRYDLRDLPFDRQRAVVERHERIWRDWFAAHPDWEVDEFGFRPTGGSPPPDTGDPLEALLL